MSRHPFGVVVVGHGELGPTMVTVVKKILPDAANLIGVNIDSEAPVEQSRAQIRAAMDQVNPEHGVFLLTDMFGGTPSNLCLSFLEPSKVEVISGVNLPMLIKLMGGMEARSFADAITFIQQYGQKNIVIASQVLEGKIEGQVG